MTTPPESTLAAVKSALLAGLLDEYGEDAETWTAMRSLDRIAAAILAATPTAAHVAEPESTLAAGSECCCEYVDGCAHSGARCCKHATLLAAADRIVTSRDAHVAHLEAALAAAEARLRAVEALADEWETTVYKLPPGYPMTVNEFCRYWFKAPIRAALATPPQPAP